MSIHEWSVVNPVAHTTASNSAALPSAKVTVRPAALRRAGPDPDAVAAGEPPRPGPDHLVPPGQPPS